MSLASLPKFRVLLRGWRSWWIAAFAMSIAPPFLASVSAQTYQCATANDELAFAVQRRVVQIVTAGTDPASVANRAMYHLPKTTASKVTYVTNAGTCATVAQHYYTTVGTPPAVGDTVRVLVLKIDSGTYFVYSLGYLAGEYSVGVTFDRKWVVLGNVSF